MKKKYEYKESKAFVVKGPTGPGVSKKVEKSLLRMIQQQPGVDSQTIIKALDISYADIWNCCDWLIAGGWITVQREPLPLRWFPTDKDLLS